MDIDLSSSASNILFNLRADQNLLDPTFDRYILRTERLALFKRKLENKIRYKLPSASQWGYQQIRAHTLASHLFFDYFSAAAVGGNRQQFFAFLDDLRLVSLTFDQSSKCWSDPVEVAQAGASSLALSPSFVFVSEAEAASLSFPESLHFVDSRTAITACGLNSFTVWYTGDRQRQPTQKWQEVFNYELPPLHKSIGHNRTGHSAAAAEVVVGGTGGTPTSAVYPTLILDARRMPPEGEDNAGSGAVGGPIDLLLLTVEPTAEGDASAAAPEGAKALPPSSKSAAFRTHLIWLTVVQAAEQPHQMSDDSKNGDIVSPPKFVVQRMRQILCDGKVDFACFDAAIPRRLVVFGVGRSPEFVWDSAKPSMSLLDASQQQLQQQSPSLVVADKDESSEAMELVASQSATTVIVGAEEIADSVRPSAAEDARQQFNVDQLEECDRLPDVEDDVSAFWLDGESHELVAMTIINELLFTQRISPGGAPVFATRYDVDAIVWQHDQSSSSNKKGTVSHLFTLNAFGYIQAGHQDKRFLGCSPDGRYATLVNRFNHCFLYFQNAAVPSEHELKNRRTGKRAENIAKQLVLSMSDLDKEFDPNNPMNEFIAFHAASDTLFLLTCSAIYAVQMPK